MLEREKREGKSPSDASLPIWLNRACGPPGCSSSQLVRSITTPLTTIQRSSFLLCFATSSIVYSTSGILKSATSAAAAGAAAPDEAGAAVEAAGDVGASTRADTGSLPSPDGVAHSIETLPG